jgi:hypothetical protein
LRCIERAGEARQCIRCQPVIGIEEQQGSASCAETAVPQLRAAETPAFDWQIGRIR